jgi:hypothetical protein
MVFLDFVEENLGIVVFVGCIFISLILISVNIFLPIPLIIKSGIDIIVKILVGGSFTYFIFWGVKSMWAMPELEAWEWFLVIGICNLCFHRQF